VQNNCSARVLTLSNGEPLVKDENVTRFSWPEEEAGDAAHLGFLPIDIHLRLPS
jgi:hypothetical protein